MKIQLPTKWRVLFWTVVLILGLLAEAVVARFNHSALGRIWIDGESCGLELYQGGYRNWNVMWSLGYAQEHDGTLRHFWCRPIFIHTDLRKELGTNIPPELRYD